MKISYDEILSKIDIFYSLIAIHLQKFWRLASMISELLDNNDSHCIGHACCCAETRDWAIYIYIKVELYQLRATGLRIGKPHASELHFPHNLCVIHVAHISQHGLPHIFCPLPSSVVCLLIVKSNEKCYGYDIFSPPHIKLMDFPFVYSTNTHNIQIHLNAKRKHLIKIFVTRWMHNIARA